MTTLENRTHALEMTTEAEVRTVREVLTEAGLLTESVRYAFFAPEEPPKDEVLAGGETDRRFRAALLDLNTGRSWDTVVSTDTRSVVSSRELDPPRDGQPPIIDSEFEPMEDILNADPRWTDALAARGIDPASVRAVPLSAGVYDYPEETGRRLARAFAFRQDHVADHPWAHPVDGLVAYVDLTARTVDKVIDHQHVPVPDGSGNFQDPEVQGPPLDSLKPIEITQPEGRSFTVEGNHVRWGKWDLRYGFNEREGLTLHQISFDGRPIVYRASVAEMVVPYADPAPVRFWQNYFDCGEYMFARYADSLKLGCDCLGDIHYTDAVVTDDFGNPRTIENAICMHEEDYGVLWKHTDVFFTQASEVRRQRRLVLSFFVPIGNYDYGFYWYLYLDGTIQLECKATGIVFASGTPGEYASEVAPGVGAPYHQHLFCARLDMTVDGVRNAVEEVEAERVPMGEGNPYGNAFRKKVTPSDQRVRGPARQRRVGRADLARGQPGEAERARAERRLRADPGEQGDAAGRRELLDPRPRRVRDPQPVGHPLRAVRALPRRRLREPERGRRRAPGVDGRGPRRRQPGRRRLAHVRHHALPAHGGLAGDAGGLHRVHAQAGQLLRPEPGDGRAVDLWGALLERARWRGRHRRRWHRWLTRPRNGGTAVPPTAVVASTAGSACATSSRRACRSSPRRCPGRS